MPRLVASLVSRSIWWLFPSTRPMVLRVWLGSRRSASSKIRAMRVAVSEVMLAVTYFPFAFGDCLGTGSSPLSSLLVVFMMSLGVRATGVRS